MLYFKIGIFGYYELHNNIVSYVYFIVILPRTHSRKYLFHSYLDYLLFCIQGCFIGTLKTSRNCSLVKTRKDFRKGRSENCSFRIYSEKSDLF